MTEEWRPVKGWEGSYEVSNRGVVRSLSRIVTYTNGRERLVPGQIMTPRSGHNGYVTVGLSNGRGKSISRRVHRLVAMAFLSNPQNLPQVNHIDHCPQNNAVENLEWCDALHNMRHASKAGRMRRGEAHSSRKLSNEVVRFIRQSSLSNGECGRKFGVHPSLVSRIRHRLKWTHI